MGREETLKHIENNPEVSVLIIGGGINGIGTFRDLALQGVDVLLVEMNDFCSGASAGSSHMVHGGLRYLENGEFRLVREALTERNRLLQNAPHYVKPLPTTIPIFTAMSGILNAPLKFLQLRDKPSARGAIVIKLGLMMYDLFTMGQQTLPRHRFFGKEESLVRRPELNPNIIATATYYDAWMPYPERIALEIILDAEAESPNQARALNYVKAVSAGHDTVVLRDQLTGKEYAVKPKIVINAAGPWIDFANETLNRGSRFIGGTKGSHLIVDHPELFAATQGHEMFFENADGRICLFFPLEDRVLIGTTDIRIDNPDEAICTEDEVDYMLEMVKLVFPNIHVDRSHIVYRFSGVRPLPSSAASTTGQISRDHSINAIEAGARGAYPVLSLVGGKWTTFRAFSEKVTDDILGRLGKKRVSSTLKLPIGGGKNFPKDNRQRWINDQTLKTGLPRQTVEMLLNRYGGRAEEIIAFCQAEADAPLECVPDYTHREIIFLAQHEKIVHLDDLLMRRSLLAMLGKIDGGGLAELAHILAGVLGWDVQRTQQEITQSRQRLISQHGVSPDKLQVSNYQPA